MMNTIKRSIRLFGFGAAVLATGLSTIVTAAQEVQFSYTEQGLIASIDGPRTDVSDTIQFTYDDQDHLLTVANALGHVRTYSEYNGLGLPGRIVNENGLNTVLGYDGLGQLTSTTIYYTDGQTPTTAVTLFGYDVFGQLTSVTSPDGAITRFEYDAARRLTATENPHGERIEYTLNALGNETQRLIKDASEQTLFTQTRLYDELGQLIKIISPFGHEVQYQYDADGHRTTTIDAMGQAWTSSYDALDRVVSSIDPDNFAATYGYDALDRVTSVTDQRGLVTSYTHDAYGDVLSQTSPDTGTMTYSYDHAGNRTYQKDARGVETFYAYDALNRQTSASYPANPEENVVYQYDEFSECSFGRGHLSVISDLSGFTQYRYDERGIMTQKRYKIENQVYGLTYKYDNANHLVTMTYPSGRIVHYERNVAGDIDTIQTQQNLSSPLVTLASNIKYLPFGGVASYTYGNGLTQTLNHDLEYRLTGKTTDLTEHTYSYDANNNITAIQDVSNSAQDQSFQYDTSNRLKRAQGVYGVLDYNYDEVGNRLALKITQGSQVTEQSYQYSAASNRLTKVEKTQGTQNWTRDLQYDLAGNIVSDKRFDGTQFTLNYNDANRLLGVDKNALATSSYLYNALGQRVAKVSTDPMQDEHYHYEEQGRLVAISNRASGEMSHYIYLNEQRIALIKDTVASYDADVCWGDGDLDGMDDQWEQHHFGNLDRDGLGDADGDGFTDVEEFAQDSNPNQTTLDTDSLPDAWELAYFGSLGKSPDEDTDGDGYTNQQEYDNGTDPTDNHSGAAIDADSDNDGMLDRWEMQYFGNLDQDGSGDFDNDGIINIDEYLAGSDPTVKSNILAFNNPNLLASYTMDNIIGSTLVDESPNNDDGVITGAKVVIGKFGHALSFDGTGSTSVALGTNLGDVLPASVSFWIKPDASDTSGYVLQSSDFADFTAQYYGYAVSVAGDGKVSVHMGTGGNAGSGARKSAATAAGLVDKEVYSHIAVNFNAFGNYDVYVNGVAQSLTYSGTGTTYNPGTVAGKLSKGNSNSLFADLDQMRFYKLALTESEVTELYQESVAVTLVDTDNDGLPDIWEQSYFGDLTESSTSDADNDGIINIDEYLAGSDPTVNLNILAFSNPNLLTSYTMDNIIGSTLVDESPNNDDGVITGAKVVIGKFGNALSFNGTGSTSVALGTNLGDVLPASVSFWIKPDASDTGGYVLQSSDFADSTAKYYGYAVYVAGDGNVFVHMGTGGNAGSGARKSAATAAGLVDKEVYSHIVVNFNAFGNYDVYVNGVAQSLTYSGTGTTYNPGTVAGKLSKGNSNSLFADLDQMRFYKLALTESEVTELYQETGAGAQ